MEHITAAEEKKRAYHSRVRQRQADETRRRILVAAQAQFERSGFALTTMETIAEEAEVSPKTVATVFGSKSALLAEVINPDGFSAPAQRLIEEVRTCEDPKRRLELVARLTRQAYESQARSLELLRTAGAVAPELGSWPSR